MIQRQQSIWLLLAAAASMLGFFFPFFGGAEQNINATSGSMSTVNAGSSFFLIIVTAGSVVLGFIAIFLYKNRKMQFRLAVAGLILSLIAIALYFSEIKGLPGVIALSSVFSFLAPVFYLLALRGIRNDEKLIKNLNKLR